MKLRRFHRINIDIFLRLVFLLGFTVFYLMTIKKNTVTNYVHPRIIPYIGFAIISFIFIILFMVKELFKVRRKNTKIGRYIIFLFPVLTAFIFPPKTMISESAKLNKITSKNIVESKTDSEKETEESISSEIFDIYSDILDDEGNTLSLEDGRIILDEDNFIKWIDEIYINVDKYEGKTIELTGFVFRNNEFKQSEFVMGRLMMVCCAADTQVIGFLCNYDKASELEEGSWNKISGILKSIEDNEEKIPLIEIESIEEANRPENEFIYPY
ncbi:TIGR03943 family protein [uncultured Tissierella sp.]|jgi:putative membrane protein|uniref:TIGR03943 family putative permease subunit n=1 Tax=uncultured Tissierella sp. TaxID=448160 RepID=UPI002803D252|nr:TIGR03943 family protein [uncultured Tissierella sp.]MDU5082120.1 TIGR03943 family protein [Bacillota bacterium]